MQIKQRVFRVIIVPLVLLLGILSCKEAHDKPPIVRVDTPIVRNVELYGEYVGRVRAFKHVEVRARVEGFLEKRLFEEGKRVEEGELLFLIDPTMYRARLNEAKAKLKQAHAAKAKSERDVQRLKPLYEKNAASQLDLDNAVSSLESQEANIAISEAYVDQAELQLSFTEVRSPLTGRVGERQADIGAFVGGSGVSLLTTVFQTDTVAVLFSLTALDYLRSKERNVDLSQIDSTKKWKPTIEVTLADNTVYPIKGIVDFTNPEVDTKTGTFIVRAELPNDDRVLLPGQFTKVKLLVDVLENSVVIPRKSLIIEDGGAFVYIMRNDSVAEKRFVETGAELRNEIVINRGLSSRDKIVIEGQHKLSPGLKMLPIAASDTIYQFTKTED